MLVKHMLTGLSVGISSREWMAVHKSSSSRKYERKLKEEKRMSALMEGFLRSNKPRKELAANLFLTAPGNELDSVIDLNFFTF